MPAAVLALALLLLSAPRSATSAGDRVVVPFPIACGRCFYCTKGAVDAVRQLQPQRLDRREDVRPLAWLPPSLRRRAERAARENVETVGILAGTETSA